MTGEGMHADTETFRISSLQEAEAFGASISRYSGSTTTSTGYDICDPIRNIYNYSRIHSKNDRINGKLLNAYIDLELTYLFMFKDSIKAASTHNRLHNTGKTELGSILDDFDLFSDKMDILYFLSAFSFRIRAFWDKYMGVLILLHEDQKYEKYIKDKSRRSFFVRHAKRWPGISIHLRKCLTNTVKTWLVHSGQQEAVKQLDSENGLVTFPDPFLEVLDEIIQMVDTIRTPEAHGAGFLRKWTLANLPIDRSKDFTLINHWNIGNEFMQALRMTIAEVAAQSSSLTR